MYLVAGLIIEKITGQTWDSFIKDRLFIPLAMTSSSTSIIQIIKSRDYAHPHLKNEPIPLMNMDNIAPAGSINSTIEDMLIWMKMWIDAGVYNENKILSKNIFQTITSPKCKIRTKLTRQSG